MATKVDLEKILSAAQGHVDGELAANPDILPVGDDLDLSKLSAEERKWAQVDEIVALVADLKNSTQLGTGKHAASTAAIYEAAVKPAADFLDQFDADDLDIQGDCVIGVFWGDRRMERAFCAGVTIKTFSERILVPGLEGKWEELPETGYKLGLASSRILVKPIGNPRKPDDQEEVWVGKAVNYAAKAAQTADRDEMLVTASAWDDLEPIEYITYSCGCDGGPSDFIWDEIEIDYLPDADRYGRKLKSNWCVKHGDEFCDAILAGKTDRGDVAEARKAYARKMTENVLAKKRIAQRQLRRKRLGR
ncbi:MAG: hypothetical protein WD556_09550 [Actinomycetota bacterium]